MPEWHDEGAAVTRSVRFVRQKWGAQKGGCPVRLHVCWYYVCVPTRPWYRRSTAPLGHTALPGPYRDESVTKTLQPPSEWDVPTVPPTTGALLHPLPGTTPTLFYGLSSPKTNL